MAGLAAAAFLGAAFFAAFLGVAGLVSATAFPRRDVLAGASSLGVGGAATAFLVADLTIKNSYLDALT